MPHRLPHRFCKRSTWCMWYSNDSWQNNGIEGTVFNLSALAIFILSAPNLARRIKASKSLVPFRRHFSGKQPSITLQLKLYKISHWQAGSKAKCFTGFQSFTLGEKYIFGWISSAFVPTLKEKNVIHHHNVQGGLNSFEESLLPEL